MRFTPSVLASLEGRFHHLKPGSETPSAQRDSKVVETVSSMLSDIQRRGMDAVLEHAARLDRWEGGDLELTPEQVKSSGDRLPADLREAIELGADRTRAFATETATHLTGFEVEPLPGLVTGVRYVPVGRVGAYLPAGRFPLTASAFMTVGVAKAAGVPTVVSCTPPQPHGGANDAVVYAAHVSGVDRVFVLGGVQALAAMAFGLVGDEPVDMLVGAGNAFVAEAKRQLFGRTAIDLLAGPSEVAVIADETADATMVAADLLAQAEHGPTSPACLITTSAELATAVEAEIERQLAGLATRDIAGAAWRDWGSIYVADSPATAIQAMDLLAPEHLEILTADPDHYLERLTNYGSLFLGEWSTVAYADKGMSGTNHVLPTGRGARYTAGLSVTGFLKQLTYQRATQDATRSQAEPVVTISDFEQMPGHRDSAQLRLDRL